MARQRVLADSPVLGLRVEEGRAAPVKRTSKGRIVLRVEFDDGRRSLVSELSERAAQTMEHAAQSGDELVLMELGEELSSTDAAELLGMSRPSVTKLLDAGVMASRREGRDRRVLLSEVIAFNERRRQMQSAQQGLAALAASDQDLFAGGEDEDLEDDAMDAPR